MRFLSLCMVLAACGPALDPGHALEATPALPVTRAEVPVALTDEQKLRALRLISVFENSTIELQFDYVEALGDGRGFTCGLGFTTGTGDALQVVETYTQRAPSNALAPFLPRLRELAAAQSSSTSGLRGFTAAWKQAAKDAVFQQVQIAQTDVECYQPALTHAHQLGLRSPLGLTILYDTVWMHGEGDDPDSVGALLTRTGPRERFADEPAYLKAFLAVRRADLLHPSDPSTQAEWSQATGRVDTFSDLVKANNLDLRGPIHVGYDFNVTVP